MTTTYPDRRVIPTAALVLACLRDEAALNPKPPAIVGFRTGTTGQPLAGLSEDECCEGAALVRVVRTYPSWGAPVPAAVSVSCAQPQAVQFELSMWRCAPMGDVSTPPSQAEWDELHVDLLNDRLTLMATVCCVQRALDQRSVMYGEWAPVATDGGCVGSTLTIDVDLYKET